MCWASLACLRRLPVTAPFVPVSLAQGSESTSPERGPSDCGRDSARPWGWGPCFGSRIWTFQQSPQISCIAATYTCVPGPCPSRGSCCPPPCPPAHRILTLGSRVHSPVASSPEVTPFVCWPGPSPVFFVLVYAFFCLCHISRYQEGAEMGVLILSVPMNWLCPQPRPAVPSGGRRAASQLQAGCSSHASGSPDLFLRIV